MLSTGPFSAFGTTYGGFHKLFPEHQVRTCTLQQHFQMPFFRELALGLGGINASTRSIKAVLNKPEGNIDGVMYKYSSFLSSFVKLRNMCLVV